MWPKSSAPLSEAKWPALRSASAACLVSFALPQTGPRSRAALWMEPFSLPSRWLQTESTACQFLARPWRPAWQELRETLAARKARAAQDANRQEGGGGEGIGARPSAREGAVGGADQGLRRRHEAGGHRNCATEGR